MENVDVSVSSASTSARASDLPNDVAPQAQKTCNDLGGLLHGFSVRISVLILTESD